MTDLILRRIVAAIPLLLLISIAVFGLLQLVPGGPLAVYLSNPDVRPEDLERFAAFQSEVLDALADRVEPGGVLVYATCSIEPEENEHVVRGFLERHADFRPDPVGDRVPAEHADGPWLATRSWRDDVDGMFAARLVRDGSTAEIAFEVADEYQGRGIGSVLARELAADARAAGVATLVATVCGDNPRVVSLLARIAESVHVRWRGGEREIVLGLGS